ncbi:MAG: hypothetical protein LBP24_01735, partial [Coriobacteriales bacterium]|nr:hypothetical protein [Coriobacteriales bacterium]
MRYTIEHQIPGRIRVGLLGRIPAADACALAAIVEQWDEVQNCTVYPRTGSLAITYRAWTEAGIRAEASGQSAQARAGRRTKGQAGTDARIDAQAQILEKLDRLKPAEIIAQRPSETQLQAHAYRFERTLWEQIVGLLARRVAVRLLLPPPLRLIYQVIGSLGFIREAIRSLARVRLDVPVLDAAAIGSSLIQGKADDAGST